MKAELREIDGRILAHVPLPAEMMGLPDLIVWNRQVFGAPSHTRVFHADRYRIAAVYTRIPQVLWTDTRPEGTD